MGLQASLESLAALIDAAEARSEPTPLMSRLLPGITFDQAVAIQHMRAGRHRLATPPVYKVSRMPQRDGALSPSLVAPLAASAIHERHVDLGSPRPFERVMEAELVVEIDRTGAITGYGPGLELPLPRLAPGDRPIMEDGIAANLFADHGVIGPIVSALAGAKVDRMDIVMTINGREQARNPVMAMDLQERTAAAVAAILRQGWPVRDGTRIFTGALLPPLAIAAPVSIYVDFGCLGAVSMTSE